MEFFKKNKINILYITIIIVYALIVFITGFYHEPWADEAQAFIHARDYSIKELFFEKLKYEGHPIIWYVIIKLFLLTKLFSSQVLYENLYIITCTLNIFSIYLLLFKSKIPNFIKILLPFTFFLIYQYPVIARNHSLVFPMLAIIAIFYKNRINKPYIYSALLIILANISAYTFVLSASLFIFFIYETWNENKIKIQKYIPCLITGLSLFLTSIYLVKPIDCVFTAKLNINKLNIINFLENMHANYFNYDDFSLYKLQLCIVILFYLSVAKLFCKNKYQLLIFTVINSFLLITQTIFYVNDWHYGYSILFIIFLIWIFTNEKQNKQITLKNQFILTIPIITILIIQIFWGIKSISFDIKNDYCASKKVSNYIKKENLENKHIATLGYKSVSIYPYFEKNIFYNLDNHNLSSWKKENIENNINKIKKIPPNILIIPKNEVQTYEDIINNQFEEKEYCGYIFSKGNIKEDNCFIIYKCIY